jgi:putative tryptophan/tyrosine transport system substrate-binding protein
MQILIKPIIKLSLAISLFLFGLFQSNLVLAYTGVTVVMGAPTSSNLAFVDAFKTEMSLSKNTQFNIKVVDLQATPKLAIAENSELVLALGAKALEACSKLKSTTPVIGLFTASPIFNAVLQASGRSASNFTSIMLEQPFKRQFLLIKTILPQTNHLGVLLGENTSQFGVELKAISEKNAIVLVQENIYNKDDLIPKLKSILVLTDALIAIPDAAIYNQETTQPILLTSYRHQKPVFAYSQSYVKAGALAAIVSSTKQLAKQAAEIAVKSRFAPNNLPPPQAPKYFSVKVNYQVAKTLKIPLSDENTLYTKIQQQELPL